MLIFTMKDIMTESTMRLSINDIYKLSTTDAKKEFLVLLSEVNIFGIALCVQSVPPKTVFELTDLIVEIFVRNIGRLDKFDDTLTDWWHLSLYQDFRIGKFAIDDYFYPEKVVEYIEYCYSQFQRTLWLRQRVLSK